MSLPMLLVLLLVVVLPAPLRVEPRVPAHAAVVAILPTKPALAQRLPQSVRMVSSVENQVWCNDKTG